MAVAGGALAAVGVSGIISSGQHIGEGLNEAFSTGGRDASSGGDSPWSSHAESAGDLSGKYDRIQATRDPSSQWFHEKLTNEELLDSINNAEMGEGIVVSPGGSVLGESSA
jgi:hypothetical protein